MSKIISFSLSEHYLEKLRSLYPSLSENLAAKQFLADQLDLNQLGLDAKLDAKNQGEILDDLLYRVSVLESRLDGSLDAKILDDKLDDSENTVIEVSIEKKTISKHGYTDKELAEHLGCSVASIKKWRTQFKKGQPSRPYTVPDFFEKWELRSDNLWEGKDSGSPPVID